MSTERTPLFVGKRDYYRRRLTDAARLLPVLGVGLFMFPLFWISPSDEGVPQVRTVSVMLYLFIVWIGLAGISGLISRRLGLETRSGDAPGSADRED